MITTTVWYPTGGNVGHASARIGTQGYVSWWPTGDWKRSLPGGAQTFDDDVAAEGRQPDASHTVVGLDEAAGLRWWRALVQGGGAYQAARYNCAWAVINMLKAAGADARIAWHSLQAKYNVPVGWMAPQLCIAAGLVGAATGSARIGIAAVDHCTTIWTPADAIRFARAIR